MHRSLLLGAVFLAACASVSPVPEPVDETPPLPLEIHWVRNSAEYKAILEQSFRLATAVVERRAADLEPGSWAVVIDADETLISNSRQSKESALAPAGQAFEEVWDEWVERREAPALPGARRFLERVSELGGRIAVVTNRRDRHCPQTVDNLRAEGIPFDVILCRGETGDKHPRWARVADGTASPDLPPLDIVMWLGDNILDFPGLDQDLRFAAAESFSDFGEHFFILPNPLYGSWEDNPPD